MDILSRAKANMPKITIISGLVAWIFNTVCYILNFNNNMYAANISLVLSLIYMFISIYFSVQCIKMTNRSATVLAFMYWASILILTLPITLEFLGILSPANPQNTFYYAFLVLLNAPLFGFSCLIPQIAMPFIITLISGVQISVLTWGVCKMRP